MNEYILYFADWSKFSFVMLFRPLFCVFYPKADPEKVSAYECGFDPFDDRVVCIRFYLVAILFIIFDLEVTFLFPGPFL